VDVKIGYLLRLAWFVSLIAHTVPCAAIYAIAIIAQVMSIGICSLCISAMAGCLRIPRFTEVVMGQVF
jgi:hypothetical protein